MLNLDVRQIWDLANPNEVLQEGFDQLVPDEQPRDEKMRDLASHKEILQKGFRNQLLWFQIRPR
jgi:hypothetical protein